LGEHSAVATYYGDRYNNSSTSASVSYTVTGVKLQADAAAVTVGQSVILTATVGGNDPGGTVTFKDGANEIGTTALSQAQAVLAYTFNAAGLHQITAEYSGDSNNPPATSTAFGISVGVPTTTILSLSPNPVNLGQTLTATVTVNGNSPTGTVCVQYSDGNLAKLGKACADLTNGQATIASPVGATFELGTDTATATYQGDSANASSTSASVSYDVIGVTLNAGGSKTQVGQPVTFTATVGGNNPSGTVRFLNGANEIGAVALSQGHAVLTYAFTTADYYYITAEYSGDGNNAPATSRAFGVSVVTPTVTTLSLSPNPVVVGNTMTAIVTVSGSNAGGKACVTVDGISYMRRCEYLVDGQAVINNPSFATLDLGSHTAVASYNGDFLNDSSTSPTVGYTIIATNSPPSVTFTSPADSATFIGPTNLLLAASASDVDGTIVKVEFFNGQTLLAMVTQPPYQYNWAGVTAGTYQLTAKATDNLGAVATSAAVNVTVAANQAPTVSMTATATDTIAPATVALAGSAADVDGSIAKVEFFNGQTLLATVTQAPYQYNWAGVTAGTYQLTAKATDNLGVVATSVAVNVTVTANQTPAISITATPSNATAPATVVLAASAADVDGSIAKVEFFNGENLLGTTTVAPYSYTWTNVAKGNYIVLARTTDNRGATAESLPVFVRVSDRDPGPVVPVPGQAYYIQSDHLNTPRVITHQSNDVVWEWDNSDPFGNNIPTSSNGFEFNLRFPGQYFDRETGLHYNYFRDYDPATGRYVQSDPIGLAGGINTYAYVNGNPLTFVDPDGNFGVPGAIAGGVVGAISGGLGAAATGGNVLTGAIVGGIGGAVVGGLGPLIGPSILGQSMIRGLSGAIGNILGQAQNVNNPCFKGFNVGSTIGSTVGGLLGGIVAPGSWGTSFSGLPLAKEIGQRAIAGIPGAGVSGTSGIVGNKIGQQNMSPNKCGCE
jgi:RHS repeat-associated protein